MRRRHHGQVAERGFNARSAAAAGGGEEPPVRACHDCGRAGFLPNDCIDEERRDRGLEKKHQ